METNNRQEYIDVLIDNFNKYYYYTNDQSTILSLQKLKNVKTNKDLSSCLKELHNKNLVYPFLHQESYINLESITDDSKFDVGRFSKSNALANIQKIRDLQNNSSNSINKLKI